MTASCIYKGWVSHNRFSPKPHGFNYHVFMMLIDLDELPDLFKPYHFWSTERANVASFKRADYFGQPNQSLKESILALVETITGKSLQGPVRLLTNLRYFGHCFNPVSFYYCYAADGKTLQAIVSHITNTPWGEDYAYVHDIGADKPTENIKHFSFDKQFHVSPFMPMNMQYQWTFKQDNSAIVIHMKNYQNNTEVFNATLNLTSEPITQKSLNLILMRYPFMTIKVVLAIYWNALLIWLKGNPFFSHPNN